MDETRATQLVGAIVTGSNALTRIACTALRNRKSLGGGGHYAAKFHDELVKVIGVEKLIMPVIKAIDGLDTAPLEKHLETVKSTTTKERPRVDANKQVRLICETEVLPNIQNLTLARQPASEMVLSASVLAKAPAYLQRSLLQANGCYESRWFDAASVMIRKLVENLIIDVYEKHGKEVEIKTKEGDYLMLSGLITALLSQTHWQLQRETKRELPEIKKLGDRAAHNRRYEAMKQDIDNVRSGLRTTVDDLLHLAGFK
ncbi:MAG TPA: hypothetical protein VHT23_08420 [Gemmatimonadaceae bacterium]|jgi:hypothetical protein|nr:hypothetical protein [Gemmatimonadaceae bacterium]